MSFTVSSPVDAVIQQTTLAGMFHALVPFATIDTTNAIFTITGTDSGGLAVVGGGMGGGNVLKLTASSSTLFSAACFIDQASGIEHGAIGWGNQNAGALENMNYWEMSDTGTGNVAPLNGGMIVQTSFRSFGLGSYLWVPRILFGADLGDVVIYAYDSSHNATSFTFDAKGLSVASGTTGLGQVGYDDNACTVYRNGNDSNANYSFGGSASAGKGHLFFTAGVKASQTLALQVADDYVVVARHMKHTIMPASDPHVAGVMWNNSGVVNISAG